MVPLAEEFKRKFPSVFGEFKFAAE